MDNPIQVQRGPDGTLTVTISPPLVDAFVSVILHTANQLKVQYPQPQVATAPLSPPARFRFGGRMKVSKSELAETLGVSYGTVANWQRSGVIPYYKIRRCIRFDVAEVEHALQRFRHVAVGEPRIRKRRMQRIDPQSH